MYHDKILETYRSRFGQLSETKRFHFASRLNLTQPDDWSRKQLSNLNDWFFGGRDEAAHIDKLKQLGRTEPDRLHLNAAAERLPFFAAHPWLFGYELQLFQTLHAHTQFHTDLRPLLRKLNDISTQEVDTLASDPEALAVLSTYLIDVYYLHHRLLHGNETALIPLATLKAALAVPFDPVQRPRLNIYLLTHCIIGETLFYSRPIPADKRTYYQDLAGLLEDVATKHWDKLTLDNKLEVALCLQLTGSESTIISRATEEADSAYDDNLGFIADPLMQHKNDLEWAEHRNVLYLLVTRAAV